MRVDGMANVASPEAVTRDVMIDRHLLRLHEVDAEGVQLGHVPCPGIDQNRTVRA